MHAGFFLAAFAKLREATIGFIMSVRPSVRMEHPASYWSDFYEIRYLSIFRIKNVEKIQVS
jgi:hypothetical protein